MRTSDTVDTELLCVDVSDFQEILYEPLNLKWQQILTVLDRFAYFKNWTQAQRQDCCTLSTIQQYAPLDTIYAEDVGKLNSVFFVLSGECRILQCLKMKYKPNRRRNKHYKLQEIEKLSRTRSMELMEKLNKAAHQMRKSIAYGLESLADFEENQDELSDEVKVARSAKADEGMEKTSGGSSVKSVEALKPPPKSRVQPIKVPPKPTKSDAALVKPDVNEIREVIEFVEVGIFTCGSVFGLGEEMEHRTIVAQTTVQCLQIPRFWLMDKRQNVGNEWHRMRMWLNLSVPNRQKIYNDFIATNAWREFRREVVDDVMRRSTQVRTNSTRLFDVPIISRINDGIQE